VETLEIISTSLFYFFVCDEEKSFTTLTSGVKVLSFFPMSLTKKSIKLDCLPLASFSLPDWYLCVGPGACSYNWVLHLGKLQPKLKILDKVWRNWKIMPGRNTVAYFVAVLMTEKKSLITLTPAFVVINLFSSLLAKLSWSAYNREKFQESWIFVVIAYPKSTTHYNAPYISALTIKCGPSATPTKGQTG